MKRVLLIIACAIVFIGCGKNDSTENFRQQLKEKYQGKYKLISSVAEDTVDLNNDGIASNNLLTENSLISVSEIVCMLDDVTLKYNEFAISESWPVETYLRPKATDVITTTLPPIYNPYYDIYLNCNICQIDNDYKSIRLLKEVQVTKENTLLSIESIEREDDGFLKVTTIRKLYTDQGWITTRIESRYKRYAINT